MAKQLNNVQKKKQLMFLFYICYIFDFQQIFAPSNSVSSLSIGSFFFKVFYLITTPITPIIVLLLLKHPPFLIRRPFKNKTFPPLASSFLNRFSWVRKYLKPKKKGKGRKKNHRKLKKNEIKTKQQRQFQIGIGCFKTNMTLLMTTA